MINALFSFINRIISLRAFLALTILSFANFGVAQQAYPSKPIRLIVGFAPGGGTDIVARAIAPKMGEILGQSVIVENKSGAAGTIAADQIAKSTPDGYTLLVGHSNSNAIAPYVLSNIPYNPATDFTPITYLGYVPNVLVVKSSLPVNSVSQLITLAKSNPGKYRCGTAGPGSIGHLSLEMIKSMAGVDVLHVPYRGGAPALNDLLGGHIDIMIDGAAFNSAKSGAIKALAVTGARVAAIPEVPTVAESGLTGFYFTNFWGFLMPAKSPSLTVSRIGKEIQKIAASSELRSQLEAGGISVQASTEQEFTELIKRTTEQINRIVKSANITFT